MNKVFVPVAALAVVAVFVAALAPAQAVTTVEDCSYHGVLVNTTCHCEDGWGTPHDGDACSYPRLDAATVMWWPVPGVLRWHLGYESDWVGQVVIFSLAIGLPLVGVLLANAAGDSPYKAMDSDKRWVEFWAILINAGMYISAAYVLWVLIDFVRVVSCNLDHENGLKTTFCEAVYIRPH